MRVCPKCGAVADYDPYFGAWICTRSNCDFFERKKRTQRELLNAMTNEQLGWWIESIANCDCCEHQCVGREGKSQTHKECARLWAEWLDSEVEDVKVR